MSKEVVEANKNEVGAARGDWGASEDLTGKDIQIPSALLMQGSSDLVKNRKAQIGEIRNGVDGSLLGKESIEMIVFLLKKTYKVFNIVPDGKGGSRREYAATIPATDEDMPRSDSQVHQLCYQYFGLLVTPNGLSETPYRLTMKATSLGTARALNTYFQTLRKKTRPSASVVIKFGSKTEKKDETYEVWTFDKSRDAKAAEIDEAFVWYQSLKAKTEVIIQEAEDEGVSAIREAFPGAVVEEGLHI